MKTIAFYLPQFHEVEENSKWWGQGYTEWVSVRKAKPLFWGHYQPTEPLNDNYYDLMEEGSLRWQVSLAKKYGIYGFCFYHYWFGGKMLLEKPAEMFLQQQDFDIHFCFSWANETWKRTWENVDGNGWNEVYDDDIEESKNGVLIKQEYGNRDDWIKHFMYLLPFFQDERYIKMDNKPMFILHKACQIKCLHSMLKVWNQLAKEHGFAGLFIMSTNDCDVQDKYINANVFCEPLNTFFSGEGELSKLFLNWAYRRRQIGKKAPLLYSYKATWKCILRRKIDTKRKTYLGGYVAFDKTPREGKNALIYVGATPMRFKKYFGKLVNRSQKLNNEFVFLNAWNEWGEGSYLEPDKKHGMKYLEVVARLIK